LRRKLVKYSWSVAFYGDGEGRRSLDRRVKEEVLQKVKEKRNIPQKKTLKMVNWICHILLRHCLLRHVLEGKV
jgi:hypothetical protein